MFDPSTFVRTIIEIHGETFVNASTIKNMQAKVCIEEILKQAIKGDSISKIENESEKIHDAVSTLQRIDSFLQHQKEELSSVPILEVCIETFINLSFCSRCVRRTPPLCFNTCNNLLRACYSPYYNSYNEALSRLWFVAREVVKTADVLVQNTLSAVENLIDFKSFVS